MRLFTYAPVRPGRPRRSLAGIALPLLLLSPVAQAYKLNTSDENSVKTIASDMADDMMSFYTGNEPGQIPGLLPSPYYWWEGGALMGALVDYWYYTGNTKYNDIATQGLLFQVGPNNDYMPPNQTLTEGNDDQGFWGMAVMSAAEYNFPDPPADKPQWLALAQAVFNTQAARWDTADCNGGLRWQIFTWNNGYDYKNSISQACFFNLAARLALYTGNQTYADWAVKTWDWMRGVELIDDKYYIYDGSHIGDNCTSITPYQFSYNAGAFLLGAAAMYNYTSLINDTAGQAMWYEYVDGLINGTQVFFTGAKSNIMTEVACESVNMCDNDELSFKAYLSRWMAATTKWAPWSTNRIMPYLEASATAAASLCVGGDNGRMCGLKWNNGTYDGTTGVGQQMAAMEVTLANMIHTVTAPVTNNTGGTSQGDPSGGGSDVGRTDPYTATELMRPITAGDRAGAAILTIVVLGSLLACIIYMIMDENVEMTPKERMNGFVYSVGENSKKITKQISGRGGDGFGIVGMSEKHKGSGQPVRESFKVLDRTESEFGAGSDEAVSMAAASPTHQRSAHFRNSDVSTLPPDLEKGPDHSNTTTTVTGGRLSSVSPKPFAPAHVRGSRSLSSTNVPPASAGSSAVASKEPSRGHRVRKSDPGQSSFLSTSIPEDSATVTSDSSDLADGKPKGRSFLRKFRK